MGVPSYACVAKKRALVRKLRTEGFCTDCGRPGLTTFLTFDHVRNPRNGVGNRKISTLAGRRGTYSQLLRELANCELRCRKCHRRRHANER